VLCRALQQRVHKPILTTPGFGHGNAVIQDGEIHDAAVTGGDRADQCAGAIVTVRAGLAHHTADLFRGV
jgi:hypothetical protein